MKDPPEPVRLYKAQNGIWRGEIKRDGQLYWWSLGTRDEKEARRKWALYIERLRFPPIGLKVVK